MAVPFDYLSRVYGFYFLFLFPWGGIYPPYHGNRKISVLFPPIKNITPMEIEKQSMESI